MMQATARLSGDIDKISRLKWMLKKRGEGTKLLSLNDRFMPPINCCKVVY